MNEGISYDDSRVKKLFEALGSKARARALRGGFKRAATYMRKVAINNLRTTAAGKSQKPLNTATGIHKGIRAETYRKGVGFRVTIAYKKAGRGGGREYGFHKGRYNKAAKPVLLFAERGTKWRKTKSGKRRGALSRYGFMAKTKAQTEGKVTELLKKEILENVKRVAKRYGAQC